VIGKPRSNSYHFVPLRDVARPAGAPCPFATDGTTPYDRGRTLFLRLKDRMRVVRTDTRDFSDAELLATKESIGQVYLDVSTKLAPDDFARDLRKLRPAAECRSCELRPRCTGCWEPMRDDVFTRDDQRVKALVAGLRGRCSISAAARRGTSRPSRRRRAAGAVEYTCVDPDEGRLRVLASRYPFARTLVGARRGHRRRRGPFDHVLVLRSYNHLLEPAKVLDRAIGLLRVGGR
jgi:hypothetical protein